MLWFYNLVKTSKNYLIWTQNGEKIINKDDLGGKALTVLIEYSVLKKK